MEHFHSIEEDSDGKILKDDQAHKPYTKLVTRLSSSSFWIRISALADRTEKT
jgi:hypothetical protein